LAAAGYIAPAMAAALMIASSLSVTLNAARLTVRKLKPPHVPRQQGDLPTLHRLTARHAIGSVVDAERLKLKSQAMQS
jgi:hypothetical protein